MVDLDVLNDSQAVTALSHALASATLCVQQRGCVPPTGAQVLHYVAQGTIDSDNG